MKAKTVLLRWSASVSPHARANTGCSTCRDTSWGDFGDYDGDLSRANAIAEYRVTKNFGIFAGYDWFKLDGDHRGSDGLIGLKQEFKGPVAGVTFAF